MKKMIIKVLVIKVKSWLEWWVVASRVFENWSLLERDNSNNRFHVTYFLFIFLFTNSASRTKVRRKTKIHHHQQQPQQRKLFVLKEYGHKNWSMTYYYISIYICRFLRKEEKKIRKSVCVCMCLSLC